MVETATRAGTAQKLLTRLSDAIDEAKSDLIPDSAEYLESGIRVAPHAVKMFTDNLVLAFPISDDGESEFGRMIYSVASWQLVLLKHGFFVRGGITVGPIYMDDDLVFGQGLIDAYKAETQLAVNSRIVLSESAMDLVHQHLAYYSEVSESPHNLSLLVDSDSQMFLNYLWFPIDGAEEIPPSFMEDLRNHRDLVISRLLEFFGKPAIWSKYAWVGLYHNHFCDLLPGGGHLKVERTLLAQPPRFLGEIYERKGSKMFRDGKEVATFKHLGQWRIEKQPE